MARIGPLHDGTKRSRQFYADMDAYDRVYAQNPREFRVGWAKDFRKRAWAGWNDPMCWFYVVDGLAHAAQGYAILPGHLSDWLNRQRRVLWFTPQVVGRVMSQVHLALYRCLVEAHGQEILPFERYDGHARATWYVLDSPGAVEVYGPDAGRIIMMALRRVLMLMVRASIQHEGNGKFLIYPDLADRIYLDPEDLKWKQSKARLKVGRPPQGGHR